MSFLTYLSPLAYLSLQRTIPAGENQSAQNSHPLDIPISHLRTNLRCLQKGVTLANLTLAEMSEEHLWPSNMSMANVPTRPTFPLLLAPPEDDHSFPQLDDNFTSTATERATSESYTWVLDFTQGATQRGVVVSQSRMKEIELAVNPLGTIETVSELLSFSAGSWLELLVRLFQDCSYRLTLYSSALTQSRHPSFTHPPTYVGDSRVEVV